MTGETLHPPDIARRRIHVTPVSGRWPPEGQHLLVLAQQMFPAAMHSALHDADPKRHLFRWKADGDRAEVAVTALEPEGVRALAALTPRRLTLNVGIYDIRPEATEIGHHAALAASLTRPVAPRMRVATRSPVRLGVGGSRALPLPVPWLLFTEPQRCWAAFAAHLPQPPPGLAVWQRRHVAVADFRIQPEWISVEGAKEPGFTGWVELLVHPKRADDDQWRWTWLMARYAQITGVGARRARGAGRIRLGDDRAR